jgi:two-component system, cell cycle sensor histidine kinase and response regulator CckA
MSVSARLKLLAALLALTTVLVVLLQYRGRTQFREAFEEMQLSRRQVALLVEIDGVMDRESEARGPRDSELGALSANARSLLQELRASAEREASQQELDDVQKLIDLQRTLESGGQLAVDPHEVIDGLIEDMVRQEQDQIAQDSTELQDNASTLAFVAMLVSVLLTAGILFGIIAPLRRYFSDLIQATQRIAGGDLVTPVSLRGPRDLAVLGGAIDTMRAELHEHLGVEKQLDDLRRFDAALQASELRYRALFDRSPLPMWVFDRDTLELRAVNDAMVHVHGYSASELLAMRVTDLLVAEDADVLRRDPALHAGVRQQRCKDGMLVELDISAHEIVMDGRVCVLCVGVDVTEARRLDAQLRQAQKMEAIGQLAGGGAHDFNNILAVIHMNAELLEGALDEGSELREDVRDITAAAARGVSLTRQLLAFSRKDKIKPVPIAINNTVLELQKMLSRLIGEDIEISTRLSPRSGTVHADPGQLEQVLLNLVVNARDAMPRGGRIEVETSCSDVDARRASELGVNAGRYTVLSVTDTGTGMDDATKARMFEPFFTTKAVGKGTGLGLATVFGIVSQSGGAIVVDSELGRGSTFRIYLPNVAEAAAERRSVRMAAQHVRTATVLVVEDEDQLRSGIRRLLASWGYRCIEARNGDEALAVIAKCEDTIDLLLTDLVMPGVNGRALATRVARSHPNIKVILMSGYTEHRSVITEAVRDGEVFLAKPFTGATLAAAIADVLSDEAHDAETRDPQVAA